MIDGKLTPEQIKNWRTILVLQYGPYALIMPDEQVQLIRDRMQAWADEGAKKEESHVPRKV